jgi:hypothetical protein
MLHVNNVFDITQAIDSFINNGYLMPPSYENLDNDADVFSQAQILRHIRQQKQRAAFVSGRQTSTNIANIDSKQLNNVDCV